MSGGHVNPVRAVAMLEALKSAGEALKQHPFDVTTPTAIAAFLNAHGEALFELLTSMSYVTVPVATPSAYDVLQIAHRLSAAGEVEDAGRLRRLADHMITQAATPSPVCMGVDYAEGVTIDAAESLKALGEYIKALSESYHATAFGLIIGANMSRVGDWIVAVSKHPTTAEIGRIKPFPMHGMQLGGEVGHG